MNTIKDEVKQLLDTLPDDCSLEDVQYHLYVIEKIQHGVQIAECEGTFSQQEAEGRLKNGLSRNLVAADLDRCTSLHLQR